MVKTRWQLSQLMAKVRVRKREQIGKRKRKQQRASGKSGSRQTLRESSEF
jgi:hypothetical protein